MKNVNKILNQKDVKIYTNNFSGLEFEKKIKILFEHQKNNWDMFKTGWEGFFNSEVKSFNFGYFNINVQFNHSRFVSSSAKVDTKSISERKCFLCIENLPEQQKGVLFQEKLIFLCNPAPIFNEHYTIAYLDHLPQKILGNLRTMLDLIRTVNGEYSIFYNGPKCGASAPDHLHFQACGKKELQTEKDIIFNPDKVQIVNKGKNFEILMLPEYLRNLIIIKSSYGEIIEKLFEKIYDLIAENGNLTEEPMQNLLLFLHNEMYHLVIFPRDKHRPDVYFKEGDERMLISPGLVDMAGTLITPLEKDFIRINGEIIKNIYDEVTLSKNRFQILLEKISKLVI